MSNQHKRSKPNPNEVLSRYVDQACAAHRGKPIFSWGNCLRWRYERRLQKGDLVTNIDARAGHEIQLHFWLSASTENLIIYLQHTGGEIIRQVAFKAQNKFSGYCRSCLKEEHAGVPCHRIRDEPRADWVVSHESGTRLHEHLAEIFAQAL